MEENWAVKEARKAKNKDIVILENPEVKRYLDRLLLKKYWPVIHESLKNSGYPFSPQDKPETELKESHVLTRSLLFMLFDEGKAFFRGTLSCSKEIWCFESEFFLGLSIDTDPQVIFEIIGNSRFRGNPPTLIIDKTRDEYYQITLHAGQGAGWGVYDEQSIKEKLKENIGINIELYELSQEGIIDKHNIGEFLTLAYQVYEAF